MQGILFCIFYLGYRPRIASESVDSGEVRLEKIANLILSSRFSIHDLSRCQASAGGELFRLNMPFELGVDYGARRYGDGVLSQKKILILETERYRFQKTLSDIAGCDIKEHGDDYEQAIRQVRNWLVAEAGAPKEGAAKIIGAYIGFQEWHYEFQLERGFSDADIQDYPTSELLAAMTDWQDAGRPITR